MKMHAQAHISGHISGTVPIQTGSQLSDLPLPNGSSISSQMQRPDGPHSTYSMGSDFEKTRQHMRENICKLFQQRKQQPPEMQPKLVEMATRLEEVLYKNAATKEEYTNLDTLEQRLQTWLKLSYINHSQQRHPVSSSSSFGTMIPNPGMAHRRNFNSPDTSSVDNSTIRVPISGCSAGAADTVSKRSTLPTSNGSTGLGYGSSFGSSDGSISTGFQHSPTNVGICCGGNNVIPPTGLRRTASQIIPTRGMSTNVNSESYNSSCLLLGNTLSPQPQPSKQFVGGPNSHIMHDINGQMSIGLRSGLQPKYVSYTFPNGDTNDGLGSIGDNIQLMHNPVTSEGPSASHFDPQCQQHLMQPALSQQMSTIPGDGYGMRTTDLSGPEKLYVTKTTVESALNSQNLNKTALTKLQIDQSSKLNFQSRHVSQQQMPKFQQQELQQQPHLFQQQNQRSLLLKNNEHMQHQVTASLDSQVLDEQGMNFHVGAAYSKVPEQFQLPEVHSQLQQIVTGEDRSSGAQMLWEPSGGEELCPSLSQNSSQNNLSRNIDGAHSDAQLHGQWHSQPQEKFQILGHPSREEFRQRVRGSDEAQRPHLSSNGSLTSETSVSRLNISPRTPKSVTSGQSNAIRDFRNQIRWLLFLRHAGRCLAPEGKCVEVNCIKTQQLLKHMEECKIDECSYPRCHSSKRLIQHHKMCRRQTCPICIPVRNYIEARIKSSSCHPLDTALQSMVKRVKVEHPSPSPIPNNESSLVIPATSQACASQDAHSHLCQQFDIPMNVKCENTDLKKGSLVSSERGSPLSDDIKKEALEDAYNMKLDSDPMFREGSDGLVKQESIEVENVVDATKQETDHKMAAVSTEQLAVTKSGKPKIKGVSLTELFTPEEIRRHIIGLRQWVGQSKAKAEKNQAMEHSMSENSCQLCAVEKLSFEPPPIYCTSCGSRVKRNAMYYTIGSGETRHYICIPCYNEPRGETIVIERNTILKATMEKKKNDEETEEWWVQCDKCEAWQHQICALFNGRRNDGGQAEYTCPNCYIGEIESGERKPLPQSTVLGAKDLPKTILSDYIEDRLLRRLMQEKEDRARIEGKNIDEVPGADALVVRVVSSVDKKLDVKPRFLEIFQEENHPTEFPYKSKVILLFQKIEGVEVCLFGMYVQEFGSESLFPNQRRVYLSYLDSVKYFRPDIKAVTGEALRTFVYHEILIAYLEYCKKRGFTSCYIWACPPLKGEDYILYCHPEIQKTPKSDKLREWYLSMLRKASKENIVVELTNLYDHFFISTGECKAKVTAARLPYFDGDYWPGAAEDMINQLCQEEDGRKQQKKGKTKKILTKRALKAAGQIDLSGNASKDILLMQKLGETISPMKDDFIMVHLQHACTHCCHLMTSGTRWVCSQCKNFQLCDKCYDVEQKLDERDRHPIYSKDAHRLDPIEVTDVPEDTKDMDDILESEFFDTRQAFLSLCQGNHYQYDTLRRAKHSSMMVLYHLHNPTAPAFVTTCNICHNDVETGQGWRCESCPDYDLCNSCYQKDGGVNHPHKLTNHPSVADCDVQNKEARQLRVLQLRKMLDLLVHASQCKYPHCPYPNCRKVKGLFRHGIQCKTRASGGCVMCKKMWYLLQLHARACKESPCHVPRCKDLKEHLRRLQQQADSRRRAAVMEMMRQRAAEVASNSG